MITIEKQVKIIIEGKDTDTLSDICEFARRWIRNSIRPGASSMEEKAQDLGCDNVNHFHRIQSMIEKIFDDK